VILPGQFIFPRQFVLPQSGHFNGDQYGQVFIQRQFLERSDSICPIMIGDGCQAKLL
jgi:hypothetical protein